VATVDIEELRLTLVERLPSHSRWFLDGTPWDWDFSRAARPLQAIPDDDAATWIEVLPQDWRQMLVFGEENFAEGGGAKPFLTVHARTGRVLGLDVERERSAVFLLNTSIPAFIETFVVFDNALRHGGTVPAGLREQIRAVDPESFERSKWRDLIDELAGGA
jgi:hypothetical protein